MRGPGPPTVRALMLALPAVFLVHVAEEAPSFVAWFNAHVSPPITMRSFLGVNAAALAITSALALAALVSRDPPVALLGVAWAGFLMLANGLFHLTATLADGRYCPGVVTGTVLYLPVSLMLMRAAARETGAGGLAVAAIALAGGLPMAVHGYLIVFRGSRLF